MRTGTIAVKNDAPKRETSAHLGASPSAESRCTRTHETIRKRRYVMKGGVMSTKAVVKRLESMGGRKDYHGGEVKMKFQGATIIVGRNNYSRAMPVRMERKLRRAGLSLWDREAEDAA